MSIADANFAVLWDRNFSDLVPSQNVPEVSEIVDATGSERLTCYDYGLVIVRNVGFVHI